MSRHAGVLRSWRPFFSQRELNVHEIRSDHTGLDMIKPRQWTRDLVVQTFGVPPEVLGILSSSNRATITAADYLYAKNVLTPRLEFLRSTLQERLVPEYDPRLVIDYVSPIEADKQFQLEAAKAAPHTLTVDEWRGLQGFEPLPNREGEEFVYARDQTPVRRPADRRNRFDDM